MDMDYYEKEYMGNDEYYNDHDEYDEVYEEEEYDEDEEEESAIDCLLEAAEQGDAIEQFVLGDCYAEGRGVPQDYAEAVKWYRRAAEQGLDIAQNDLGYCYENGYGIAQSHTEAAKWYRKAAEQGQVTAQFNLGCCYDKGHGVPQIWKEAMYWYQKAAEQGDADAQQALDRLYDEGKIAREEPSKTLTSSSQMVASRAQPSQQTQSERWPIETHKSSSSNTAIIVICIVLLLICGGVGGYFYYNNVYLPKKVDREAPRYYTFGNLMLRSSQIAGVDYNKIAMLPYGTKFIMYSYGAEWSKVKVESADPTTSTLEGYVATPYILNPYDFFLLNSIFADVESRDAVPTSKAKLALLAYYKNHNYVGRISDEQMKEADIGIAKTNSNQWQVFVNVVGKNPCEVFYKKLLNKDSKYNDFAVIIKNIVSGERRLLYFYFDDVETPHFYTEQSAPSTGGIKNITMGYGGELIVDYTYDYSY